MLDGMRVLGALLLQAYERRMVGDTATAAAAWRAEACSSDWRSPTDLLRRYPSALTHAPDLVLFQLGAQRLGLLTRVDYKLGLVIVKNVAPMSEIVWPPYKARKRAQA